jgi:hypothetical protein
MITYTYPTDCKRDLGVLNGGRSTEEKYELNSSALPAGVVTVLPLCVILEVDFPWWCKIAVG